MMPLGTEGEEKVTFTAESFTWTSERPNTGPGAVKKERERGLKD